MPSKPRCSDEWNEDDVGEQDVVDLYDAISRIELREALNDEFNYEDDENDDETI
jgi:hypothetical protein